MSEDLTRRRLFGLAGATAAGAAGLTASGCSAFHFGTTTTNVRAVAAYSAGPPFKTRPDITPPHITIRRPGSNITSRYLFLNAPFSGPGHGGTYIIDPHGHFVWFGPNTASEHRLNFSVQSYNGKPVLTWFEGLVVAGYGQGDFVIADQHYKEIHRVKAHGSQLADFHEFTLTPRGTAYIPIYRRHSPVNLTSRGGSANGYLLSGVAQEIDIAKGTKVWEWDSWAASNPHVPISESHQAFGGGDAGHGTQASPWNYFHINSICDVADGSGDVLISGRNTFCVYRVEKPSGRIKWRLGGRRNGFTYGSPRARFYWQHHVRQFPLSGATTLMTVFDNGVPHEPYSRALLLKVDQTAKHVELKKAFVHPNPAYVSGAMGSAQLLPNGHMVVGWGTEPHFSEFAANGSLVLDGDITKGDPSYRVFAQDWVGLPTDKPAAAARFRSGGGATVYASWNGATAIRFWVVFAGPSAGNLHQLVKANKNGFETAINVSNTGPYFAVHALDGKGNVLGKSAAVRIS